MRFHSRVLGLGLESEAFSVKRVALHARWYVQRTTVLSKRDEQRTLISIEKRRTKDFESTRVPLDPLDSVSPLKRLCTRRWRPCWRRCSRRTRAKAQRVRDCAVLLLGSRAQRETVETEFRDIWRFSRNAPKIERESRILSFFCDSASFRDIY